MGFGLPEQNGGTITYKERHMTLSLILNGIVNSINYII